MATPSRFTGGLTQASNYQAFGNMGVPNPLFYHVVADDFDNYLSGTWTTTVTDSGSADVPAIVAGVGGVVAGTTAATVSNGFVLTKPAAGFQLTATTGAGNGPKVFFATSIKATLIANTQIFAGLVNTVTAPFTAANITDGVWFSQANAGALQLNYRVSTGTVQTVAMNVPAGILANNAFVDLFFEINAQGNILAGVGANSMGRVPQSGTGTNTPARLAPTTRLIPAVIPLTTVLLNPTVGLWTGTAAIQTFGIDYIVAAQER